MRSPDTIEFYDDDRMVALVHSSMVPPVDAKISIRGETWTVTRVTYALDYADDPQSKGMRANVSVTRCQR